MNDLLADVLIRNIQMLKMTVADISDAQMLDRPVPDANNPLWQLGHLIASEARMVNGCAGKTVIALPDGFEARFSKDTCKSNDPKILGSKAELVPLFEKVRTQTAQWVKTLTQADLDKPTGGPMGEWFPTHGHLISVLPQHINMHLGQIQVLRRKLGLPILF